MSAVSDRTRQSALNALAGMEQIVDAEMLIHGEYATDVIVNSKLFESGAICGGRQYCAVGSLWVGGGIKYDRRLGLPGVAPYQRDAFLAHRPGLRLAYEALNEAAQGWARRTRRLGEFVNDTRDPDEVAKITIEDVFEHDYTDRDKIGRRDMLRFIAQAREKIEALPAVA